ncbi:hydroxyacylglutathione hydrolase, mitochondrial-like [Argiope bruennichi]|uniref:hydroxyacylglutathione hydrolase, mitochondrial-like n=1 Tax=Argiope bruennichi TaxID=94029 RepID=UPI0024947F48|nr:hydroxyacylglutathione hydrolase, mitochondrial-like [Argiope bruennichi]
MNCKKPAFSCLKYVTYAWKNRVLPSTKYLHKVVQFSTQRSDRYRVHIIPALKDNYMYLLTDKFLNFGIAIDPVEPKKILDTLAAEGAELKAVITTHHHFDHAGGNKQISEVVENLTIYGGDERIESLTEKVYHNQTFKIGDLVFRCLHTPCHTSGHVCYFLEGDSFREPICFTGDTLFIAGCGRFFEGSARDMYKSLSILSTLPLNTKIYCGHEYSVNNLKYALTVEPDNKATVEKLKEIEAKLIRNHPSVPSTIGEELSYNPFLRVDKKSVQLYTNETDPVAVMAILRKLKDNF